MVAIHYYPLFGAPQVRRLFRAVCASLCAEFSIHLRSIGDLFRSCMHATVLRYMALTIVVCGTLLR